MKKKIIAIIIAAAVAAGIAVYAFTGKETPEAEPMTTAKASKGSLRLEVMANGIINPDVEVIVKSKAGGEIIDFPFNEGDVVEKGEVIVRLDPETEEARAKQSEATLLMTEARLEKARIARKDAEVKLGRQKKLFEDGIISKQELEDAEIGFEKAGTDVKLSQAELMQSKEALKEANERLADTRITAPFTGTILKKFVDRGQVISSTLSSASEGTQIFSMANLDNIFVTAHVDEVDISRIAPEQAAIVKADSLPGREFAAKVERVAPKGRTEMTVTIFDVVVRVTDKEKALLKPGMTADVNITTRVKENVLLVPRDAVKTREDRKTGVYVMKAGVPEFMEASFGDTDGERTEVTSGVTEGVEVVTSSVAPKKNNDARKRRLFF